MKPHWLTYLGLWLLIGSLFPGLAALGHNAPDMHLGLHLAALLAGVMLAIGIPRGPMSR